MFNKEVQEKATEVVLKLLNDIEESTENLERISYLSQAIQRITWLAEIKQEEK